jgi:membrane glycosyltransferase
MLFHTRFVLSALTGLAVTWKSPPREDAETSWKEAVLRHGGGTLLGAAWAAGVYWLNAAFLWWLLPIVGSLVLSIPLSVWSSRVRLGRAFRAQRLFLIPEESHPPRELRWTRAALRRARVSDQGFARAIVHPVTNAVMCAAGRPRRNLPEPLQNARLQLVDRALAGEGPLLGERARNALLNDPASLSRLHYRYWTQPGATSP